MQLTDSEQQRLEENQEILELKDVRAWQLFRTRIEAGVAAIEQTMSKSKLRDWEHYLTLETRKETLQRILNDLDTGIPSDTEALQKKLETEPDNSPATGSLS